jgi:hypothetical protein
MFSINTISTLGQTGAVHAKNQNWDGSYQSIGFYRTKLPVSFSLGGADSSVYAMIEDIASLGCPISPGCLIIAGDFLVIGSRNSGWRRHRLVVHRTRAEAADWSDKWA